MPNFVVTFWEKVTCTYTVEAEDEDQAEDIATELGAQDPEPPTVSQGEFATMVDLVSDVESAS